MLGWMHLELYFKGVDFPKEAFPQKKPEGGYKELLIYLKNAVDASSGLISRYFFLFEPKPHLFLALEVKDTNNFESIRDKINRISRPAFIDSYEITFNASDADHPESVLDFFYASTKYAFFRITDDYQPGYYNNDETKIIHCFCNQLFVSHENEKFFYLKGIRNSGFQFSSAYECLRESGFAHSILEFLFWDLAVNNFSYKGQKVYILRKSGKEFYFTIEYCHKVNGDIRQDLLNATGFFLNQKETQDYAKELIDKNLASGAWITKPHLPMEC